MTMSAPIVITDGEERAVLSACTPETGEHATIVRTGSGR
jgi:hypothetical protein